MAAEKGEGMWGGVTSMLFVGGVATQGVQCGGVDC